VPCSVVEVKRRCRSFYCLHQQGDKCPQTEVLNTSETSANSSYVTISNIGESRHFHARRLENLKSYQKLIYSYLSTNSVPERFLISSVSGLGKVHLLTFRMLPVTSVDLHVGEVSGVCLSVMFFAKMNNFDHNKLFPCDKRALITRVTIYLWLVDRCQKCSYYC
jgi:hypothetical protein